MNKMYSVSYYDDNNNKHLFYTAKESDIHFIQNRFKEDGPVLVKKENHLPKYAPLMQW